MTHDLGDRPARRFLGRLSRATAITESAPVPLSHADAEAGTKAEWALAKQAWDAEMLIQRVLHEVDVMLPNAQARAHQNDLLDLQNLLTGRTGPS